MILDVYYNISEKKEKLKGFCAKNRQNALLIVPSQLDCDILLDLIYDDAVFSKTVDVVTMSELLSDLSVEANAVCSVVTPYESTLILKHLTDEFIKAASKSGAVCPNGVKHSGFIKLLAENIKDLLAEEASPDALKKTAAGEDDNTDNTVFFTRPEGILAYLYEKYLDYLKAHNLSDPSQASTCIRHLLYNEAVRKYISQKHILLVGFLTYTGSQKKLVKELEVSAKELVLMQPESDLANAYDGIRQMLKQTKQSAYNAPKPKTVKTAVIEASNNALSAEALAREITLWAVKSKRGQSESRLYNSFGAICGYGDIGISVPKTDIPLVEYALNRYKIPYSLEERLTVGETPLGTLPGQIWRAFSSGWGFTETSLLVYNRLLFGDINHEIKNFPDSFDMWCFALPEYAEVFKQIRELCFALSKKHTPSEILSVWSSFAEALNFVERAAALAGDEYNLDFSVNDISHALFELKKKIKSFENMREKIGEAADVQLSGYDAVAFLNEWGRSATLPIRPHQCNSVALYSGTPTQLTEHRFWIMFGVDYNSWPGNLRESILFPGAEKKRFNNILSEEKEDMSISHMPLIDEKRVQLESRFRRLAMTGLEGFIITHTMFDESRHAVPESQFFNNLAGNRGNYKWEAPIKITYGAEHSVPSGTYITGAEIPLGLEEKDEADTVRSSFMADVMMTSDMLPEIAVGDVDTLVLCPFKYWCERILKIRGRQTELADKMREGSLLHAIWQQVYKTTPITSDCVCVAAEKIWQETVQEKYPELLTDKRLFAERERLHAKMQRTAEYLSKLDAYLISKNRTEIKTELPVEYRCGKVTFRGRIDRADIFTAPSGSECALVLDYKSGASAVHKEERQPAIYSHILKELGHSSAGYGWIGHTPDAT